jgi:hypothetical protein
LIKIWKAAFIDFKELSQHLPAETEENQERAQSG